MMDFHTDWSTTATILGTLGTVLPFIYGIISSLIKKNHSESDGSHDKDVKELKEVKEKSEKRISSLEDRLNVFDRHYALQEITVKSLQQGVSDLNDERKDDNKEYLDKLSHIEDRIGKMLDLIISINNR